LLKDASRRVALDAWLDGELVPRFTGRILSIDQAIADRLGRLAAQVGPKSQPPIIDGLLAATAFHYNLTLITRYTRDVAATGVPTFSPWGI
jgi:toxin FitB